MMIDIDKAVRENEQRIETAMARHRERMAKLDKEVTELRNQLDGLIGVLADCKLEMRD